jgi:hypothetical protein
MGTFALLRLGSQIFQKSFGRLLHILNIKILQYILSYKVTVVYANYVNTRNTSNQGNGLKRSSSCSYVTLRTDTLGATITNKK